MMLRISLILILPALLGAKCGAVQTQSSQPATGQVQQADQSNSGFETKECDFSAYKPFIVGPYQVGSIQLPKPQYPHEVKERRTESRITVRILINPRTGDVEKSCAINGDDELVKRAAEAAALEAKFSPSKYYSDRYSYLEGRITYKVP
jgi:outer membrane biosynthesis protein TonB